MRPDGRDISERPGHGSTGPAWESRGRDGRRFGTRARWPDAANVLRQLLQEAGVPSKAGTIGRVKFIGEGLSNAVFGAAIERAPGREEAVVVKLPSRYAESDRDTCVRAEAALLRELSSRSLPFRISRPLGEIQTSLGLATVQEWVDGMAIDLRAANFPGGKPWELVARVAAAVHAVDPEPLRHLVPSHVTRRDHAEASAETLRELDEPEARETMDWVLDHLPPAAPSSLLHGDLLGQNLRLSWDDDRVGVIDWGEARIGDPADDLAIVTRGARKAFGVSNGLRLLLDGYNELAAASLTVSEVRLHELILVAHLYRATVQQYGFGSPAAENQRGTWRSVLGRARSAVVR